MRPPPTSSAALVLVAALLPGCTPTCEQVCDHVVGCDNLEVSRLTSDDCQEQCRAQDDLLNVWTDEQLRDAFDAELRCLGTSSCAEIEAGACYDESVWSF